MEKFSVKVLLVFFTSLGIILGGSMVGSLAAIITNNQPLRTMIKLANEIKIWAIAASIGGTFVSFEILESGIFSGEIRVLVKQALYVLSAILGAQIGEQIIKNIAGGKL